MCLRQVSKLLTLDEISMKAALVTMTKFMPNLMHGCLIASDDQASVLAPEAASIQGKAKTA